VIAVGAALLLAVGRALAQIHVEQGHLRWLPLVRLIDPVAGQIDEWSKFSGWQSHFVSNRPIWLAEAWAPVIARSPTTQRIAGSWHSPSASFAFLVAGQPSEH
jgi:hypothetical protein